MKKCPKCFASLDEAGVACASPHCSRAGIPVSAASGEKSAKGEPVCAACNAVMTARVCLQCGFELADAGVADVLSLSLVGASGSGKSNYLATLIHELGGAFCRVYGATLYPTGGERTMLQYERYYHRPLFGQGVCVPPTRAQDVDPLTYTLVFPKDSEAGRTFGLAFYDTDGRIFGSEADMALSGRSIYHGGGILFMLDPSQLPLIAAARRARGLGCIEADATAILLRTVHLLRAGLGLESVSKKIPLPLAVCLTKLDSVSNHLDAASFLTDKPRSLRRPTVSAADLAGCGLEAQSLIEAWGGREFLGHVHSQFADAAFFALSALGKPPTADSEAPRVLPHRVLDPLLWLLVKNNVIKSS